jgi:AcrR family transcriptional regulator
MPRRRARNVIKERLIDVAVGLAEEGGFENVRQRDVARRAGVALGTLYKSFRGKGDLLSAALERETEELERRLAHKPARGGSAADRVTTLLHTITRTLWRRPNYARAVLRAVASGEPEVAANIMAHQKSVTPMVVAAMRGTSIEALATLPPTAEEETVALLLQQVWFGAMVGWSARLYRRARVLEQMAEAARLMLR